MPNLPTEAVTVAQLTKVLSCFGTEQAEAVAAYKVWLVRTVRAYVLADTRARLAADTALREQTALVAMEADLPPEPPIGPML